MNIPEHLSFTATLNQSPIICAAEWSHHLETKGPVQNGRPARPQALWHAERTAVREHDKGPRTPLASVFNRPPEGEHP